MTDTLTDDDIIDVRPSSNRPTSSSSSSTISTTTRRPMFIETEVRTDTVTTRRMASAAANRSVHDVLENTKSPTHDRESTSYAYAHSNSYAPVSRPGAYELPVTARRPLNTGNQNSLVSNIVSALSSPSQILSTVQSQITKGYETVKDRVFELTGYQQGATPGSPSRGITSGGTRFSRTSSQSSGSGGRKKGYNLRSRPVHSTPRDIDSEQQTQQRKTTTKHRKDQHEEIDEEEDEDHNRLQSYWKKSVHYLKKLVHSPIDIFDTVWNILKGLPLWLLIPLLLLLGLYALPHLGCKPFERFYPAKVNAVCRDLHQFTNNLTKNAYDFGRRHTYERGVRNLKQFHSSFTDLKDSILNSLSDVYYSAKNSLRGSVGGVKDRVSDVVETTAENAKEYYDAGIQKVNSLIEELKHEREKILGVRHTLKPDQEKELSEMVRKLIDEYAADETGQADYALEANGGKVVDTRCQEYTDEPRQNVVKFLGIPIVHMSKQPDIIIKHGRMPGQCFPFKGDHGSVVIRLAVPVVPTEFVLEHLSKSISIVGHINSAPNNFTVYALKDKHDKEGIVLGRYYYDAENGPALQRFKPQIGNIPVVEYIEVQVTSNWGNPNYTCLYRFRVHGDMQTVTPTAA
jgi:SUN domain-containing protein 1/2